MSKKKAAMPDYYGKNIAQNAQKRFFKNRRDRERREKSADTTPRAGAEKMGVEKRAD